MLQIGAPLRRGARGRSRRRASRAAAEEATKKAASIAAGYRGRLLLLLLRVHCRRERRRRQFIVLAAEVALPSPRVLVDADKGIQVAGAMAASHKSGRVLIRGAHLRRRRIRKRLHERAKWQVERLLQLPRRADRGEARLHRA